MEKINGKFRKKKVYFTQVSNHLLDDKTLSWKAKGIYAMIQRYITIEDWNISVRQLISMSKDGEKSFMSGWKELKDKGYLKQFRIPSKENRGQFEYEYELLDVADTSTPSLINCDINGAYKIEEKVQSEDENKEDKNENDHTPQKGGNGEIENENDHTPQKGPYAKRTTCLKDNMLNGGYINNTYSNNTYNTNTNTSSSSKNETYCSIEDPEELEKKIDELMNFTVGSFKVLDCKKFLNASRGDVDIIKYVYENTLSISTDENREPIRNMVVYIIKAIEKEIKNY